MSIYLQHDHEAFLKDVSGSIKRMVKDGVLTILNLHFFLRYTLKDKGVCFLDFPCQLIDIENEAKTVQAALREVLNTLGYATNAEAQKALSHDNGDDIRIQYIFANNRKNRYYDKYANKFTGFVNWATDAAKHKTGLCAIERMTAIKAIKTLQEAYNRLNNLHSKVIYRSNPSIILDAIIEVFTVLVSTADNDALVKDYLDLQIHQFSHCNKVLETRVELVNGYQAFAIWHDLRYQQHFVEFKGDTSQGTGYSVKKYPDFKTAYNQYHRVYMYNALLSPNNL